MSIHLVTEIHQRDVGSATEVLLLAALADGVDEHGNGSYPDQDFLAQRARCSERHVRRLLDGFNRRGILAAIGARRLPNGREVEQFRLNISLLTRTPKLPAFREDTA